jgi:endonuclease/exonuclease/phosphatase family metal-dependent hydrolase
MKLKIQIFLFCLFQFSIGVNAFAQIVPPDNQAFRVVSWNISGDSYVTHKEIFRSTMTFIKPDVIVLDEVIPTVTAAQLQEALIGIDPSDDRPWNIDFGASGGRQRGVIASRLPLEPSFSLTGMIPYPEEPRQRIGAQMSPDDHQWIRYSMDGGIPVNGVIITVKDRRLLVVSVDLQCCGGLEDDWQETRRQLEARVIRDLLGKELSQRKVDGIILAGDLNSVATNYPEEILAGSDKVQQTVLKIADVFHIDGVTDWTWDGRDTPFASGILDYQFYSPDRLIMMGSYIFDAEDYELSTISPFGLDSTSSIQLSRHRPLIVDYSWRN